MPTKDNLEETQQELMNLAEFVAKEKFDTLRKEIEELLVAIEAATPNSHKSLKKMLIKIATSQVAAAIGNTIATIVGADVRSLVASTTTALMSDVENQFSANMQENLEQVFDAIGNVTQLRVTDLTKESLTENAVMIKEELAVGKQDYVQKTKGHKVKSITKDAAKKILKGAGQDIVDKFYDELRKTPEVVAFVKGNTANLPKEALEKLEEHNFFVDTEQLKKQLQTFDRGNKNFNLEEAKVNEAFTKTGLKDIEKRYYADNKNLTSHLASMSKLLDFIILAKEQIPEHKHWNESIEVIKTMVKLPLFNVNINEIDTNVNFFPESKKQYGDLKAIMDRVVAGERIPHRDYVTLIAGMEKLHFISHNDNFFHFINDIVYDVNIMNSKNNKPLFPYYYMGNESVTLLVKEAQVRRKASQNFELDNFNYYVNEIITRGEKSGKLSESASYIKHKITEDKGQEFAVKTMQDLNYVEFIESKRSLLEKVHGLTNEVLSLGITNRSAIKKGTLLADLLKQYDDLNISNIKSPSDEMLQKIAAVLTRILNTAHFDSHGNQAQRVPYPIFRKIYMNDYKIPRDVVEAMRAETAHCRLIQKNNTVAENKPVSAPTKKHETVEIKNQDVKVDLQNLKTGLQNVASFVAEEKLHKLQLEVQDLVNAISKASVEDQEKMKRILISVAISTITLTIDAVISGVTGGAGNSLANFASSSLTREIEKQLTLAVQNDVGQFFNAIGSITKNKIIGDLTQRAIDTNAEMLKSKIDKGEFKGIACITPKSPNISSAADKILAGKGKDVIKDFYDELRKQPEVLIFVSGHTAKFPNDAFEKKLKKHNFFINALDLKKQAQVFSNNEEKIKNNFQIDTKGGKTTYLLSKDKGEDLTNQLHHMSKLIDFVITAKDRIPEDKFWGQEYNVDFNPLHPSKPKKMQFFPENKKYYENLKKIIKSVNAREDISAVDYNSLIKGINDFQLACQSQEFFKLLNHAIYVANTVESAQNEKLFPYYYMGDASRKETFMLFIQEAQTRRNVAGNFDIKTFDHYVNEIISRDEEKQELAVNAMQKMGYINVMDLAGLQKRVDDLNNKVLQLIVAKPELAVKGTLINDFLVKRDDIMVKNKLLRAEDLQKFAAISVRLLNTAYFNSDTNRGRRESYPILHSNILDSKKIPRGVAEEMRFEAADCKKLNAQSVQASQPYASAQFTATGVEELKAPDAAVEITHVANGLENLAKFIAKEKMATLSKELQALAKSIAANTVEERTRLKKILLRVAISTVCAVIGGTLAYVTGGATYSLVSAATSALMNDVEKQLAGKEIGNLLETHLTQLVGTISELAQTQIGVLANTMVITSGDNLSANFATTELNEIAEISDETPTDIVTSVANKILQGSGKDIVKEFYSELRKQPEAIVFVGGHAARFSDEAFAKLEEHNLFVNANHVEKKAHSIEKRLQLDINYVADCFQVEKRNGLPCHLLSTGKNHDIKAQLKRMSKLLEFVIYAKDRIPDDNWNKLCKLDSVAFKALNIKEVRFFPDTKASYIRLREIIEHATNKEIISDEDYEILLKGMKNLQLAYHSEEFFKHLNDAIYASNTLASTQLVKAIATQNKVHEAEDALKQDKLFPYYFGEHARKEVLELIIKEAKARRSILGSFDLENFNHYANEVIVRGEKQELAMKAMQDLGYVKIMTEAQLKQKVESLKKKVYDLGVSDYASEFAVSKQKTTKDLLQEYNSLDKLDLQKAAILLTQIINVTHFKRDGHQAHREPYPIHPDHLDSKLVVPNDVVDAMQLESASCREFLKKHTPKPVPRVTLIQQEVKAVEVKSEPSFAPAANLPMFKALVEPELKTPEMQPEKSQKKPQKAKPNKMFKPSHKTELEKIEKMKTEISDMLKDKSKADEWMKTHKDRVKEINDYYESMQNVSAQLRWSLTTLGELVNEVNDKAHKSEKGHGKSKQVEFKKTG